jgi:hypothetical protein
MTPAPPADEFAVPSPFQLVPNVPSVLPVLVRESRAKRAAQAFAAPLLLALLATCTTSTALGAPDSSTSSVAGGLILTTVVGTVWAVVWWCLATSRGAMLGAGPDGLWIRLPRKRRDAIFIPWNEVLHVSIWRRSWSTVLQVVSCGSPRRPSAALLVPIGHGTMSTDALVRHLKRYGLQVPIM